MIVTEGSTSVSVPFYFVDDVGGTAPGEPTSGLLFSDIETGGSASYQRQGAARVDITAVTIASASTAYAVGSFILIDDTEMPGVYRFDIPDAAVAAGVDFVIIFLRAAAAKNTITRPLKIDLNSIETRLPAALISGRMNSDAEAINDNATSAVQLALSATEIESGAAEGTPSATVIQTDLTETQDDIYIGRIIIMTSGNARGEMTDVTDYTGSTGTLTVTALANAPAAADTFVLL